MSDGWRNRIVGTGEEAPGALLPNERNWRLHPETQAAVLTEVLDEVGWVANVTVNRRSGHLVDGHLRVKQAIAHGEASIPVTYVDLDEREEGIILASLDPISALAGRDNGMLAALVAELEVGDGPLGEMLAGLADMVGEESFPDLPAGGRSEFRQMTFTVTADQEDTIKEALRLAKAAPEADTGNENSNGNALAAVCAAFVG